MNLWQRLCIGTLAFALAFGSLLALPTRTYAAPAAQGSNGCALSPYQVTWTETKLYLDNCNLTWLIRFFQGVGDGWSQLGKFPVPIAKAFGAMGLAQKWVAAPLLSRVQQSCGSRGATIYKKIWMPAPWFACGKTW